MYAIRSYYVSNNTKRDTLSHPYYIGLYIKEAEMFTHNTFFIV